MKKIIITLTSTLAAGALLLSACQQPAPPATGALNVLAVQSFIADIAQNVAGDRLTVQSLMPLGLDPHAFQPTPQDVTKVAVSQVLIVHGAGLEEWLQEMLDNAGGERVVIEASAGLTSRAVAEDETHAADEEDAHAQEGDPHFWLDPLKAIKYTENIRDGLIKADPAGSDAYTRNATAYSTKLNELDGWIKAQVAQIPSEQRLLVTNHESFGYFADQYGFKVIGAIIPSVSTNAAPSAQQVAALIDAIRSSGARAIFLEAGVNPQLAQQLGDEAGVKVVTDLYTHSITAPGGAAPTYIDMLKHNTALIVGALK